MARTTGSPVCIHIGAEERVQGSSDLGRAQAPHPTTVVRAGEGTQQPNAAGIQECRKNIRLYGSLVPHTGKQK